MRQTEQELVLQLEYIKFGVNKTQVLQLAQCQLTLWSGLPSICLFKVQYSTLQWNRSNSLPSYCCAIYTMIGVAKTAHLQTACMDLCQRRGQKWLPFQPALLRH